GGWRSREDQLIRPGGALADGRFGILFDFRDKHQYYSRSSQRRCSEAENTPRSVPLPSRERLGEGDWEGRSALVHSYCRSHPMTPPADCPDRTPHLTSPARGEGLVFRGRGAVRLWY